MGNVVIEDDSLSFLGRDGAELTRDAEIGSASFVAILGSRRIEERKQRRMEARREKGKERRA